MISDSLAEIICKSPLILFYVEEPPCCIFYMLDSDFHLRRAGADYIRTSGYQSGVIQLKYD